MKYARYAKSVGYYRKACESPEELTISCFSLGVMYERGKCVERDDDRARELYEKT